MGGKVRKAVVLAVALAFVGAAAVGAAARVDRSSARAAHTTKLRIALVLPDLSNLFIAGIRDGAQAAANKIGATLYVKGSNAAADQTNAMESYVGIKVNAIIVDAIDGHAIVPAIEAANKAGIPVIAIQSNVFGGKIATFISEKEQVAGTYIGEAVASFCKNINPCQVGIIEGEPSDQSGLTENAAMHTYVAKYKNIKIVGGDYTQYNPAVALNVATNLLTAHPGINYLYSWWDPGAAAAVQALKSRGDSPGKVGVSAQNGDCIALSLILQGWQTQTSAFFPNILGDLAISNAVKAVAGTKLPSFIEAPVLSVNTTLAKEWLAGKDLSMIPASLRSNILTRLKQSSSGKCPTS